MTSVITGQLYTRAVWQINGVDTLQFASRVDVLANGASGTVVLQGVGWQFSGLVLSASIANTSVPAITILAYNGQTRQIVKLTVTVPSTGPCTLYGEIHRIDPAASDYLGALVRTIPTCQWKPGSPGYCMLKIYPAQ